MDFHMDLHYNPYGNPYEDMKLIKDNFIYGLPFYLWITRCIRMVLHMEIHKLRWKSIYMDYHLSLWISIWITRQIHMVIHKLCGKTYDMDYHITTINNYAFPYGFPWKYIWNMYFHLVIHMKTWNYIFFSR